ncbi:MAG: hypothetical protein M3Z03_12640, partial [Actinomycetota bacterium]|nr:hypothetical protein [Actinomycetota bacterium]
MQSGLLDTLRDAETALDHARTAGCRGLSDDDLHDALRLADRLRRKAEVAEVTVLAEIDVRRSFEPLGAKTAATFAMWQLKVHEDLARGLVRCSRSLR